MLAWGGVVLGAVYLVYVGGAWWGIYSSTLRIATMAMAAVVIATWVVAARRNPAWRPRSVLLPAIAASIGSLAMSTWFSRVPQVSLEYLGYAIVLAGLYLLLVRLFANPFFRRRLATLATMLLVVTVLAFLVRVGLYWIHWWDVLGRIALPPLRPGFEGLTYNNPSAVLTMVALLSVPALATFATPNRRGVIAGGLVLLALGLVALLSGSRAGWFALGVTALVAPVALLAVRSHRALARQFISYVLRNRPARFAGIAALAGGLALAVAFAPAILQRAGARGEPERIAYAVAAIRMFESSPIVGTGPGTWVIQRMASTSASEPDYYIPHAHNLQVQTLGELGLVGAVAGVILALNVLWLLRGGARDARPERRRWAWIGGFGLLYFLLHQILDLYVNMPAFLFAAAFPVAYLDATVDETTRPRWPTTLRRAARALGVGVVVLAIAGLLRQEIAATRQADAVAYANDRNWAAADAPARAAADAEPEIGSYQLTAGLTASRAGDHAAAAAYFARVANRDDLPEAWLNLASEQVSIGLRDEALASIRRALRLGIQRPVVAMPAGDLAVQLGATDIAVEAFAAAILEIPSLAADPWFRGHAIREAAFLQAVEQALSGAEPGIDWQVALMAGDAEEAIKLAGDNKASSRLIRAWQGDSLAADAVLDACSANPLDIYWLTWCARLEGHRGNLDHANELRDLANTSLLSAYHAGAEMRVSQEGMVGDQLLGDPADLWATYTYRRPAPWDILVPSLVHLRIE
jgi:O-antigen ligase/tetratricopeptide (TPR) repeat protein